MFALGAGFETVGIAGGWTPAAYKGYYLFGAVLNVGWLGVGTVYLLAPRRAGHVAAVVMGLISLAALVGILVAPTDPMLLKSQVPGRGAIGSPAPLFPLLTNLPGSLILIGGAAWSAWQAFKRSAPASRVLGTALIAAGANPLEVAAKRVKLASVVGSVAPSVIAKVVYEQTARIMRNQLSLQGVVAEVRLHAGD